MPGFRGQPVSVPGGAGGRITEASGTKDDGIGRNPSAVRRPDRADAAFLRLQGADRGIQANLHAGGTHEGRQGAGHIAGFFRGGKDAAPPLDHHRTSGALHQGHHVLGGEVIQGGKKEPGIPGNLGKKGIPVTVVGQVAAAFPGDVDFFPQLFIPLQQRDGSAAPGCEKSGGHAGGSAADHNYIRHACPPPDTRDRISRSPPDGGNDR